MMPADIFGHAEWSTLLPFLYIRRGADGLNGARHRIEVRQTAPSRVLRIVVPCAYCRAPIQVVRVDARKAWTFNMSCELEVRAKCARMKATTAMCNRVRAAMAARDGSAAEGALF